MRTEPYLTVAEVVAAELMVPEVSNLQGADVTGWIKSWADVLAYGAAYKELEELPPLVEEED